MAAEKGAATRGARWRPPSERRERTGDGAWPPDPDPERATVAVILKPHIRRRGAAERSPTTTGHDSPDPPPIGAAPSPPPSQIQPRRIPATHHRRPSLHLHHTTGDHSSSQNRAAALAQSSTTHHQAAPFTAITIGPSLHLRPPEQTASPRRQPPRVYNIQCHRRTCLDPATS
ncbi:hypothetical protein Dimus_017713 [Dionaea muscipula]